MKNNGTFYTAAELDQGIDKMTADTLRCISNQTIYNYRTIRAVYNKVKSFYFVWAAIQAAGDTGTDILKAADGIKQILLNGK